MNLSLRSLVLPALIRAMDVTDRYMDVVDALKSDTAMADGGSKDMLEWRLSPGTYTLADHIAAVLTIAESGLLTVLGMPGTLGTIHVRDTTHARGLLQSARFKIMQSANSDLVESPEVHDYVVQTLLPHLYFHLAGIHGILRSLGAPIGKADFLGNIDDLYKAAAV